MDISGIKNAYDGLEDLNMAIHERLDKGLANTAALIAAATSGPVDEELRESHTKLPTSNPPA
jgi:hypothetical protein